jgi:hypothetical protein
MAKPPEPWTQLATRIPKDLHLRLKVHCVEKDLTVMKFVVAAITEKLGWKAKPSRRAN